MLITLSAFLNHNGIQTNRLTDFLYTHSSSIIKIVLLNALMLTCGLLGEFGYLSHYTSTALGFIPFCLNFKNIKDTFLPSSDDVFKNAVFYWFVFFWSLYGVFAVMSYTVKNTGYNILDVFADKLDVPDDVNVLFLLNIKDIKTKEYNTLFNKETKLRDTIKNLEPTLKAKIENTDLNDLQQKVLLLGNEIININTLIAGYTNVPAGNNTDDDIIDRYEKLLYHPSVIFELWNKYLCVSS
jgi:hypothetical protein